MFMYLHALMLVPASPTHSLPRQRIPAPIAAPAPLRTFASDVDPLDVVPHYALAFSGAAHLQASRTVRPLSAASSSAGSGSGGRSNSSGLYESLSVSQRRFESSLRSSSSSSHNSSASARAQPPRADGNAQLSMRRSASAAALPPSALQPSVASASSLHTLSQSRVASSHSSVASDHDASHAGASSRPISAAESRLLAAYIGDARASRLVDSRAPALDAAHMARSNSSHALAASAMSASVRPQSAAESPQRLSRSSSAITGLAAYGSHTSSAPRAPGARSPSRPLPSTSVLASAQASPARVLDDSTGTGGLARSWMSSTSSFNGKKSVKFHSPVAAFQA
jgi:hypothetical protein